MPRAFRLECIATQYGWSYLEEMRVQINRFIYKVALVYSSILTTQIKALFIHSRNASPVIASTCLQ